MAVQPDDELRRILTLACDHLGMEAAFVSEFSGTRQVFRALAGAAESFGLVLDDGPLRTETYCDLMVTGRLPRVVPDACTDPRVRDLEATTEGRIGAYVGVPLRLSDGRLYGTFCCLSHRPDPSLDERDAKFMDLLAAMISTRVEAVEIARQDDAEVRRVIETRAVQIALQPIISLTNGQWRGAEALARFPGSSRRVDEMFALAADAGLGPDLELLCLQLALARLDDLSADVYLSVNMSPDGIADPRFTTVMTGCHTLDRVVLEVTEHAPVERYANLLSVLAPLRAAGLRLAVDDVGAGYASFRHVLQLHPDIIKIDRSLVDGIAGDSALRSIAGNVVLLGLDLRASVVAEGVEEPGDLEVLETLGADMAQGYLFARPTTDPAAWAGWGVVSPQPDRPSDMQRTPVPGPAHLGPTPAPASGLGECRTAATLAQACDRVVDGLVEVGLTMPSVYLVVDGALRCQAARGYFQVVDGFAVGVGVIGRIAATGHAALIHDLSDHPEFIAAAPDISSEAGVPVWADGQIVGVVNVESTTTLPTSTLALLGDAAEQLGAWIAHHGGIPHPPLQEQLVRRCQELAAVSHRDEVERLTLDAAVTLSGLSSAAIASREGSDGVWTVTTAVGPLARAVRRWTPVELECMGGWVSPGTSSHLPEGQQPPPGYAFLTDAGVQALAVHPLARAGRVVGLLLILDRRRPGRTDPQARGVLEQLATSAAVALNAAMTKVPAARTA